MGPNVAEAARLIEYGNEKQNYMALMDDNRLLATQNYLNNLTDSAAAGTSISCGVRTDYGFVGQYPNKTNCQNFVEYLKEKDPSIKAGIISKVYSVHATPGSFLLHSSERYNKPSLYESLVVDAKADFIAGGYQKEAEPYLDKLRENYNVIEYEEMQNNSTIIQNTQLPEFIFTIPDEQTPYLLDDNSSNRRLYQTTIENLTIEAINKFQDNQYFIMTEASMVDWGGHANNIIQNVGDMIEADAFVRKMIEIIDHTDNLNLLVIADHGCGGVGNIADPKDVLDIDDIPQSFETLEKQNAKRQARMKRMESGYTFSSNDLPPDNGTTVGDHENSDVWLSAYGNWFRDQNRLRVNGRYYELRVIFQFTIISLQILSKQQIKEYLLELGYTSITDEQVEEIQQEIQRQQNEKQQSQQYNQQNLDFDDNQNDIQKQFQDEESSSIEVPIHQQYQQKQQPQQEKEQQIQQENQQQQLYKKIQPKIEFLEAPMKKTLKWKILNNCDPVSLIQYYEQYWKFQGPPEEKQQRKMQQYLDNLKNDYIKQQQQLGEENDENE